MKKLLFLMLALLTGAAVVTAQETFYGTIEYEYQLEGENAEMMRGLVPSKMVVVYGKKSMLTYFEGGMMGSMMGKVIINGETGENFVLKEDTKTVFMMDSTNMADAQNSNSLENIQAMDEKMQILNYTCRQYKAVANQQGEKTEQVVWIATSLKAPAYEGGNFAQMGGSVMSDQFPGIPLQVDLAVPGTGISMKLVATKVEKGNPDPSLFKRPADFEVKSIEEMMKN